MRVTASQRAQHDLDEILETISASNGRFVATKWRQQILDWYSKTGSSGLVEAGSTPANFYGVRDLHGVVWEWEEDFGAMMVSADNRDQGDPDLMKFCGAGAMTLEQKENYAVLMRVAMLSSLKAAYTTASLGFRCARGGVQ